MRMLEAKEVKLKIDKEKLDLRRAIENRDPPQDIEFIEAKKAIWERVLHHIKKGEIVILDDENRIHWHVNVPRA